MVLILGMSSLCVTCCSSMAGSTYAGMEKSYHVGTLVCTLSISLFVFGLGSGPLLLGPVSEFMGRSFVLHYSFAAFFLLNFPVAFANHISVHLIFRFLTGFAGSAFLSVSGGAITDVFHNSKVATWVDITSRSHQPHDGLFHVPVYRSCPRAVGRGVYQPAAARLAVDVLRPAHLGGRVCGAHLCLCARDVRLAAAEEEGAQAS